MFHVCLIILYHIVWKNSLDAGKQAQNAPWVEKV